MITQEIINEIKEILQQQKNKLITERCTLKEAKDYIYDDVNDAVELTLLKYGLDKDDVAINFLRDLQIDTIMEIEEECDL